MAKATGKLTKLFLKGTKGLTINTINHVAPEDYAEIELPRDMKVIGKREKCKYFCKQSEDYTSCSLDADGRYRLVGKRNCPCHNWKEKKKK